MEKYLQCGFHERNALEGAVVAIAGPTAGGPLAKALMSQGATSIGLVADMVGAIFDDKADADEVSSAKECLDELKMAWEADLGLILNKFRVKLLTKVVQHLVKVHCESQARVMAQKEEVKKRSLPNAPVRTNAASKKQRSVKVTLEDIERTVQSLNDRCVAFAKGNGLDPAVVRSADVVLDGDNVVDAAFLADCPECHQTFSFGRLSATKKASVSSYKRHATEQCKVKTGSGVSPKDVDLARQIISQFEDTKTDDSVMSVLRDGPLYLGIRCGMCLTTFTNLPRPSNLLEHCKGDVHKAAVAAKTTKSMESMLANMGALHEKQKQEAAARKQQASLI